MAALVVFCCTIAVGAFFWLLHHLGNARIESHAPPFNPPAITAARASQSSAPAPPSAAPNEYRHFFLQLHGIYFPNRDGSSRQQIIGRCRRGELLQLIPEPENPIDPHAIKVCRANGEQLGYIDAGNAMRIGGEMSIGWTYRVTVEEVFATNRRGKLGCKIRLAVLTMSTRTEARKAKKAKAAEGS